LPTIMNDRDAERFAQTSFFMINIADRPTNLLVRPGHAHTRSFIEGIRR